MRTLKIAVVAMGVVLVAGFGVIIGRIVYLLNRPAATTAMTPTGPALKDGLQLALPSGAAIRTLSLSGHRMAVHFEAPSGAGIAILDLTGAEPVRLVRVTPEPVGR